jgi:predicted kinase
MTKQLIILRGPPGSGKSFEVKKILQKYGIQAEGGYFSPMMYKFHMLNQERAVAAMVKGVDPIIIDNMNLDKKAMQPYVQAGLVHDYNVEFVEPSSDHWQRVAPLLQNKKLNAEQIKWAAHNLSKKNQHGVPFNSILRFLKQWHVNPKVEDFK